MHDTIKSSLKKFHPLLQSWFHKKYGTPTDIQEKTWQKSAEGAHILCIAPTGCGKTLAAFLWALNQLITKIWSVGTTRVLYISPLKALNNDVRRNLIEPLEELGDFFNASHNADFPAIKVLTRSGDTPSPERQSMLRHPPEILITTPESLNLLLSSQKARVTLTGITTVIVDEIHAVAGSKRGTHLITAIDRLVRISGEFQRIGLSATVKPIQKIAQFLAGYKVEYKNGKGIYTKRNISVLTSTFKKKFCIQVQSPKQPLDSTKKDSRWHWLAFFCHQRILINRSTLIFTNNRRFSEKLTRLINDQAQARIAYTHHGSLSKELRTLVEQKLKNGELKAIVATSSLEMGIDIGTLDEILLIGAPNSFSSAIQRIGRGGHSVHAVSKGQFLPLFESDSIRCAVAARAVKEQIIEPVSIPLCPLDVCAQIILAMTLVEEWDREELFYFLKSSWPFHELSQKHYDSVIAMLCGKYADSRIRELNPRLSLDTIDNTLRAKRGVRLLLNSSGGTITDRGNYTLRHAANKDKIGELDEEFVWERSVGDTFVLGTQNWRIERIDSQFVEVLPSTKGAAMPPFWRADRYGIGFCVAEKTALFLKECEETLNDATFLDTLMSQYYCSKESALTLSGLLKRQKNALHCPLPHRYHMVIEHFADPYNTTDTKQVILHTFWGSSVNAPYAIALSQRWYEVYKYPLEVFYDDSCIILILPHSISSEEIMTMIPATRLEALLRKKLESTGLFGAYFRENAARALLLPKRSFKQRMPLWLTRLRSKKLLEAITKYPDFPILSETWRSCFSDEFNLEALKRLLQEIEDGTIKISDSYTDRASPFAANCIWRQTNYYVYQDDTPSQKKPSSLRDDLIRDLVYTSELRPRLSAALIAEFTQKLQRSYDGYAPNSHRDIVDWLKERLIIPENEWDELWSSMDCTQQEKQRLKEQITTRVAPITVKESGEKVWMAKEYEQRLVPIIEGFRVPETAQSEHFHQITMLGEWLRYYGPISHHYIQKIWGLSKNQTDILLKELVEEQTIVIDRFIEDSEELLVCDTQNLEKLLSLKSRKQRLHFEALDVNKLPLFLAIHQKIVQPGNTCDDLQNILDSLWGFPSKAALWEQEIFPARLDPYYPSWLDTLRHQSAMIWFGCGKEKISFCFDEEKDLYLSHLSTDETVESLFPEIKGSYSFWDLQMYTKMPSPTLTELLWKFTWKSHLSNDHIETIRKGVETKFQPLTPTKSAGKTKPIRFNRWKQSRPQMGHWFFLHHNNAEKDELEKIEQNKDRVYQLLDRYGILFRELLMHELPQLRWQSVFKTIRLMELSGELIGGHFFNGLSSLQFMSLKALGQWKKTVPKDVVFWTNACDPASLCGKGIGQLQKVLPERIPSNHLVYHGHELVLISKKRGKKISCFYKPDSPHVQRYLTVFDVMVSREWMPVHCVRIEIINDEKALKSPFASAFIAHGFEKTYQGLELRKK